MSHRPETNLDIIHPWWKRTAAASAKADADAAVAKIPAASDYEKDIVFQYVYNESASGRWAEMHHVVIPRLSGSGLVDIKGNATATPLGAGGNYLPQDGWNMPAGAWLNTGINIDSLGLADGRSYSQGIFFSDVTVVPASAAYLLSGSLGGLAPFNIIRWNANSAWQTIFNAFWIGATGTTDANDLAGHLVHLYGSADDVYTEYGPAGTTALTASMGGSAPNNPAEHPTELFINAQAAAGGSNTANVTVANYYVASDKLTGPMYDEFKINTERMIAELSHTAHLFNEMFEEGDSLAFAFDITNNVPVINNGHRFSISSRQLREVDDDIASELAGVGAALDSSVIMAGVNDLVVSNGFYQTTLTGSQAITTLDSIISKIIASTHNIRCLVLHTVPPVEGWLPLHTQDPDPVDRATTIGYIKQYNDYIISLQKNVPAGLEQVVVLDWLYDTLASDADGQQDATESLGNNGNANQPVGMSTGGTKRGRTWDGVHPDGFAVKLVNDGYQKELSAARYYRGGR